MAKTQLNHQKKKLAAPGTGVICINSVNLIDRRMNVLLSRRTTSVGEGLGITGGGFVECGTLDRSPVGTILENAYEAHRETQEENLNFEELFPADSFLNRAQVVSTFCVRVDDTNRVHQCTYFALRLTDSEFKRVAALPPGEEREGSLISEELMWIPDIPREEPEQHITLPGAGRFFHPHELRAFGMIAWHAEYGKLW